MPFADLDTGVRLHYRDLGGGNPIVFLTTVGATVDAWDYQVLNLADTYRCVLVDLRGTGDSDKPFSDYSFEELCADLRSLLGHLDLSDVALVGWSAGGGIALQYVLDFNQDQRVSRLVLVGAATPRFKQSDTEPWGMDEETAADVLEGARRAWPEMRADLGDVGFHRTDLGATAEWFEQQSATAPAYAVYRSLKALFDSDLRDRLGEVELETLVLHGRHEQTADPRWAEYLADRIDAAELVWLEDSAHFPFVEEPDKVSTEIADFVQ